MNAFERSQLGTNAPLKDIDAAMLESIRELYDMDDPVPVGPVKRSQFMVTREKINVEVARICDDRNPTATATTAKTTTPAS